MKRGWKAWMSVFAAVCLLFGGGLSVSADWLYETESGETPDELILATDAEEWSAETDAPVDAAALDIKAKGAVLMELSTGTLLFEQNSHEPLPIASVTKVMTLLLIMEAIDNGRITVDDTVTCSAEAASYGGSQIWLEEGERMTVDDLLKAIAVVSANDACAMMAEHLCGSVGAFVAAMNERAAQLGMKDTKFLDCCGLNDEAVSSAADVAVMTRELMKHGRITRYTTIWMDTLRGGESQLVNTNKLVRFYRGATGMKTGTTAAAGHCLSATAERDGLSLCAVVLGCDTTDNRFNGARALLDYGFANFAVYTPSVDVTALPPVKVLRGEAEEVAVTAGEMRPILLSKGEETAVTYEVHLAEDVEAPVLKGQTVGEVDVYLKGASIATYPLLAREAVDRLRVGVAFGWLFRALLGDTCPTTR